MSSADPIWCSPIFLLNSLEICIYNHTMCETFTFCKVSGPGLAVNALALNTESKANSKSEFHDDVDNVNAVNVYWSCLADTQSA